MCCLRYEHEFYVQSRRRFPKEGKVLTTAKGEEKLLSIDIFHERLTLRTAEGETRIVPLAEFNREMAAVAGGTIESYINETALDDTDAGDNGFDISPELMYTQEHEVASALQLMRFPVGAVVRSVWPLRLWISILALSVSCLSPSERWAGSAGFLEPRCSMEPVSGAAATADF